MFSLIPWRDRKVGGVTQPVTPFQAVQDEFQSMFDRFFGLQPFDWNAPRAWGLDLDEKEHEVVVRAELPGFEREEIGVELKESVLTIEAKKEIKEGDHEESRHYSHVRRSILLPSGLDTEKADAKYHNGVLEIHLPRTPQAQGRRIEIQ